MYILILGEQKITKVQVYVFKSCSADAVSALYLLTSRKFSAFSALTVFLKYNQTMQKVEKIFWIDAELSF